jgi:hypothetical protein
MSILSVMAANNDNAHPPSRCSPRRDKKVVVRILYGADKIRRGKSPYEVNGQISTLVRSAASPLSMRR